jgi:hypothetical protein
MNYVLSLTFIFLISCTNINILREPSSVQTHVKQLVDWETKANATAIGRSNDVVELKHFEIPLSFLEKDFASDLDPKVKDSLVFNKNGTPFFRWVISPEDTKYHKEVSEFLASKGMDTTTYSYLKGYYSASRSLIVYNENNRAAFSLKTSTDNTAGNWTDKKQTWDDSQQIRQISDWVKGATEKMDIKTLVIQDEPMAVGIKSLDMGIVIRSLGELPQDHKYYIPGFSALHEHVGAEIAALNGSNDPAKFWEENYVKPLANALGELSAITGSFHTSPHSQNFLIELDANKKPTGKLVVRDFGDSYINKKILANTKYAHLVDMWEENYVFHSKLPTRFGVLHGTKNPSWVSEQIYLKWSEIFYDVFEKRFSEISGIPVSELAQTEKTLNRKGRKFSYYIKRYETKSESWKNYFRYANCLNGNTKTLSGKNCPENFKKFHSTAQSCNSVVRDFQ